MTSIARLVCEALATHHELQPLAVPDLQVSPILNWGGFGNQSFVAHDGSRRWHVKLSADADTVRGLRRWRSLHDRLTERCGAPRMLGWMSLPSVGLDGVILEWIEGATPTARHAPMLQRAGTLLAALHGDEEMARTLRDDGDPRRTCADAYRASLHDRFVQDLHGIREDPPPFVTPAVLSWMGREVEALLQRVEGASAFREPAAVATHQDPWLNNVVLDTKGRVHLIDWDGMALGDPMMDWAMLLGPCMDDLRPARRDALPDIPFDADALERFELLSRASLLDWVVDALADWIEAEGTPQCDHVRRVKQGVHEGALAMYRAHHG